MNDFLSSAILLSPLWTLSLLAFIPLTAKVLNQNRELKSEVVSLIYGMAFLLSLALILFLGFNNKSVLSLKWDPYSSGACVLVNLSALISLALFYLNPWLDRRQFTEILFFFSQSLVALYIFCLSQDFMTAFIGIEVSSLILYVLLAMSRKDLFCLEAAIKYFVLSAISSAVFLYGVSFVFGVAGSLEWGSFFEEGGSFSSFNRLFFLGFGLIFAGLFFKVALFPFHSWLADVYQGALTPLTHFMATGIKSAVILFLGKMFSLPLFESSEHGSGFLTGLAVAGVLTVLFGNIMALNQTLVKRLIAFSSLAHSGYLMMALFGILTGGESGFSLLFFYLLSYIFLTGGVLTVVQCLEKSSSQIKSHDLKSLFYRNGFLALAFSIFLLGLAGIPPSFGFFAKAGLFQILIKSSNWMLLFWAFAGSAIALFYYMKPITWLSSEERRGESPLKAPLLAQGLIGLLIFLNVFGAFIFGSYF